MGPTTLRFEGRIGGAAFATGDRVVVGVWARSPFGPFGDVMWADPGGERLLLAPTNEIAGFVDDHYAFDRVVVTPVVTSSRGIGIRVAAGDLELELAARRRTALGRLVRMFPLQLRTSRRWISFQDRVVRPLARPLIGDPRSIRVTGRTRAGAREWYAIHDVWAADASLRIRGTPAGDAARRLAPSGFGFSEFPSAPTIVRVTSIFETGPS